MGLLQNQHFHHEIIPFTTMFYSNFPYTYKSYLKEKRKCSEAPLIYKTKQSLTTYYIATAYFGFVLITKQRSHSFTTWKCLKDELPLKSQKQSSPDILLNNIH